MWNFQKMKSKLKHLKNTNLPNPTLKSYIILSFCWKSNIYIDNFTRSDPEYLYIYICTCSKICKAQIIDGLKNENDINDADDV